SLMLFEINNSGLNLSWRVFFPTVILVSGFFAVVASLVFKSHRLKPRTGAIGLVGEIGVVRKKMMPEGKVYVHGELWNAVSRDPIEEGAKVRVVNVNNLVLEVEPVE
ncbi:MAG TPA: nodulation protein NfeD, partial [Bacteroidetes bacterium]|nr:nodulation protein NfeD [Bacteroidota bacterium]